MNAAIVGYSGFVGSNLMKSFNFDNFYNSKNIENAFGLHPDLLVYAGVRAEKYLANNEPEKDLEIIKNAYENIKKINPKKVILISTIDVYKNPKDVDEDSKILQDSLQAYGLNRFYLEQCIEQDFEKHLIVRLPALYGENIKKNFIYDYMNIIPTLLTKFKFNELSKFDTFIQNSYIQQENGFYKCKVLKYEEKKILKQHFLSRGFSAINFTDSRAVFQFYNLSYLWEHINMAMNNNILKFNIATEPIFISELYYYLTGKEFKNEIANVVPYYNYTTKHKELSLNNSGYIFEKNFVLEDIKRFVEVHRI